MFRLEMLPAAHGDCLWVEYGRETDIHRILIDGGPAHTYPALWKRITSLPANHRHFELLVITHIDADHIEGIIRLMQDAETLNCVFDRIWFNGREQLDAVPDPAGDPLGVLQGEYLEILIKDYEEYIKRQVLNIGLPGRIAGFDPECKNLPVVLLEGDCRLTILSPDYNKLLNLKDHWRAELKKEKIDSGDEAVLRAKLAGNKLLRPLGDVLGNDEKTPIFEFPDPCDRDISVEFFDELGGKVKKLGSDDSSANGSSIALLLEYPAQNPDVTFLLAGDAQPDLLERSLDILQKNRGSFLNLTGFKVPHHGSVANLSRALLKKFRCKHYLISTSGAKYGHPHIEAIQLLLDTHSWRGHPRLHFNYMTITTDHWSSEKEQDEKKYKAFYPTGLSLEF